MPKFPDDIIDQWVFQYAKDIGWPPGNIMYDPEKRWSAILRGKDLDYWAKIEWRKEKKTLTPTDFVHSDQNIIAGLMMANVLGSHNIYSHTVPDTKERFDRLCEYMVENGSFPRIVALVNVTGKYLIADGCHRLAAYFYLLGYLRGATDEVPSLNVAKEQEYWIGK